MKDLFETNNTGKAKLEMEKRIMFDFMHELFTKSYSGECISVRLNSKDNVLSTDLSFEYKSFEISKDKRQITLYGEDDICVEIRPQDLLSATREDEYYLFDTECLNMAVCFV